MKRQILALVAILLAGGSACAGSLGQTPHDWNGFYAGAQFTGDFTQFNEADPFNLATSANLGGGLNLQALKQSGHLVVGLAANADLFAYDQRQGCLSGGPSLQCQSGSAMDASLRAKLGYADDRLLIYGTAGFGVSNLYNLVWNSAGVLESDAHTPLGWVAGAGVSYALNEHWVASVEYLRYDLGAGRVVPFTAYGTVDTKPVSQTLSLGFAYQF